MSTFKMVRTVFVFALTLITALTLSSCSSSGYGTDANPKTSKYLLDNFVSGEYLDPFGTNSPDVGATMEALVQLSGVGNQDKLTKSVEWLKSNTDLLKIPGLKGTYLFTARALGFSDDPTVAKELAELKKSIAEDGTVADTNNFSTCWVILGLVASGETDLANRVASKLVFLSEADGGYKYIKGDPDSNAAADVTGFAIMAFKATESLGTSEDQAAKSFAIGKAKNWLIANREPGQFWLGYGDLDISGTAYATMALGSVGEKIDDSVKWLQTQVNDKDGGVVAPWNAPDSDIFSTTQSILAMSKLNFIDVLNNTAK